MQKAIEEVMDWFDFDEVHHIMEAVEWKWFTHEKGLQVPLKAELREKVRSLLWQVSEYETEEDFTIATGGFEVTRFAGGGYEVKFVVSSWTTGEYDV